MEFLQPSWLWGLLAIAVPVAIHFWNQKKGKTIEWAASRWLLDKTTLNHRGIRLHEIPLMLLRCLLVILLAFILGKPVLNWLNAVTGMQTVHLVQPDKRLVDNYRFELEDALKKGEKIFWIGPETANATDISTIPAIAKSETYLQQSVNKVSATGSKIKIYITANQDIALLPKTYVPAAFDLYPLIDSSDKKEVPLKFEKNVNVLVDFKNSIERQTVEAALGALNEVYQVPFSIDLKQNTRKKYDWILSDQMIKPIDNQTLYAISGQLANPTFPSNVIQIPDSLKLTSSAIVENGRLPELLGGALFKHYGLVHNEEPLSANQLRELFVQTKPLQETESEQMRKWLLLLFVLTTFLERWISLRKTSVTAYA